MTDHVQNRQSILDALRNELVGPEPAGKEIDCSKEISFDSKEASYGPWKQSNSGEEILLRDNPLKRYGVGVLYPAGTLVTSDPAGDQKEEEPEPIEPTEPGGEPRSQEPEEEPEEPEEGQLKILDADIESANFDLSGANAYNPSSLGVSFLAIVAKGSTLEVTVTGGRYRSKKISVAGIERVWWLRQPLSLKATFSSESLNTGTKHKASASDTRGENCEGLNLSIEAYSRPHGDNPDHQLISACVVNRSTSSGSTAEVCVFQVSFHAFVKNRHGEACILPYPGPPFDKLDAEERSLSLLYRGAETYAVGHGCAANWKPDTKTSRAHWISGECLPVCETPSITPDIQDSNGVPIEVLMAPLAGLKKGEDGYESLGRVIALYRDWIKERKSSIPLLEAQFREPAERHISECSKAADRMEEGLKYLKQDDLAAKAFQLANLAMLIQQCRTTREPRIADFNKSTSQFIFRTPYKEHDLLNPGPGKGKWRAFQIAFLLMSIRSAADGNAPDRSTVELIWFPTGGGKTEAYLGLAAFGLFLRRLRDPADAGVHVLMRYTLRLLTTQQFQRASALICAMESIRQTHKSELGEDHFSIGIWVGSANTPNWRSDALDKLRKLQKGDRNTENPFVLGRCPWCSAQMGVIADAKLPRGVPPVRGYVQRGTTVAFACPDRECPFSDALPIYVIDEDLYAVRPSLVIGTVDKFAMLAWEKRSRSLFGLEDDGSRKFSPPGIIIQDELHLIAGPLGSMVGLYEAVIEELCTDQRRNRRVLPKIICSTATIRRYHDQVRSLYGRESVSLFPPPGLDAGDSFFARYARNADGSLQRGRQYVGIHAPALGSMQTVQVRTFTSLLQSPVRLDDKARDPWWTLLVFFNSLRELGTTLSLFQSDIPNYFKLYRQRQGLDFSELRRPWEPMELTGRTRTDAVPQAIADLEVPTTSTESRAIDICLASNIIEVGVDIDRLSLMCVVGQPKTTSQYIQVTGRVGRRWYERPGLVMTLYGASKPRDRSHFEKFRSYHERLYAQVEPTSVTPFSPPVLDRALHAIMVSYVRQAGTAAAAESPKPYPGEIINRLRELLLPRVRLIDKDEVAHFEEVFQRRSSEWKRWQRIKWRADLLDEDPALLRDPSAYAVPAWADSSWPTPMSMRNVDSECQAEITQLYLNEGDANA